MFGGFVAWCEKIESARPTDKWMGLLYLFFEEIWLN